MERVVKMINKFMFNTGEKTNRVLVTQGDSMPPTSLSHQVPLNSAKIVPMMLAELIF